MNGFEPGFFIEVTEYADVQERMLACHKSQLSREGDRDFAPLLELLRFQQQTRGTQADVAAAEAFQIHSAFKRIRAW